MGLTIYYRLSWPAKGINGAVRAVELLRQRCLDLPFAEVGDVRTFAGGACDHRLCNNDDQARGLLIQGQGYIDCVAAAGGRYRPVREDEHCTASFGVTPTAVVAFSVWPGEGCESADFGLRLLPPRLSVRSDRGEAYWLPIAKRDRGWTWGSYCKTHYANDPRYGGGRHFLRCHLTTIAALDAAKQLGFAVDVSDEGGFWKNRSVQALAEEVGVWDRGLAALVGTVIDQAAAVGLEGDAPIAERPDFEHLEADGALDPKLRTMIDMLTRATDGKKQEDCRAMAGEGRETP